jgi:C4-dicarboxylate-specific signal transduction histidine kinase
MSQSSPLWWSKAPTILTYSVAVLSVAAALVAGLLFNTFLQIGPFVSLFLCAIMFVAWIGGIGPGLLATVLSILAFAYYFAPPINSFGVEFKDIPRLVLFAVAALFVVSLSAAQRSAAESLRRARDDLQAAVQELARLNKTLDEAQRLSHTGSFGWKVASGDIVWSKETYQILGVDRTVKPTIDLILQRVHQDDRELVQLALDRVVRGEQDCDNECRLLMPDGFVKHLHVRVRRVNYETGEEEIVGALMDITATRKAQEALHTAQSELAHVTRLTTLGEMSASIAHEVNQPLASVVTNGDACLRWLGHDVPQLDEARSAVERMISGASHASDVISRIRALSKKGAFERARLDVNEVINDVLVLMRREITDHRVSLRLDLGSSLPPVNGDRVQLQQVIMNLLMNGIQAMRPVTDRRRELLIRSREHGSDQMLVAVEDSGIGIEPENLDRLFNAFFTTKPDGMGIGLSICRSIIEQHDGRIWATRNAGTGSTFQFTLPAFRGTAS